MTHRIHLSIVQPAGYVHSQGFLDQARYARYQLRRLGAEVTIGKNRLREDAVNIIFGAHLGFAAELRQRHTCVFFNLEQLGEGGARVSQAYMDLLGSSAVIDYDARNLAAYGCQPGDVPVVSFQYAPYLAGSPALPLQGEIDIVGAGDAVTANLAAALAGDAELSEALALANAGASVVIHKLGTTGTASVEEMSETLG